MRLPGWKWSGSWLPMIRNPSLRLDSERHERRRAHGVGIALEDVLLPIAQRTAARLRRAQERRERPHVGIVRIQAADETFAHGPGQRIGEQHEHGTLGCEIFAQPGLELLEAHRDRRRAHELQAQLMDLLDEHVVLLRDGDEILELALELGVALPQHRYLPLDERDRCAAGAMRQLEPEHQRRVALEEVGVALRDSRRSSLRTRCRSTGAPTAAPLCW